MDPETTTGAQAPDPEDIQAEAERVFGKDGKLLSQTKNAQRIRASRERHRKPVQSFSAVVDSWEKNMEKLDTLSGNQKLAELLLESDRYLNNLEEDLRRVRRSVESDGVFASFIADIIWTDIREDAQTGTLNYRLLEACFATWPLTPHDPSNADRPRDNVKSEASQFYYFYGCRTKIPNHWAEEALTCLLLFSCRFESMKVDEDFLATVEKAIAEFDQTRPCSGPDVDEIRRWLEAKRPKEIRHHGE